jgi:hypothetical protein
VNIQVAVLCDAATEDNNIKLSLLGAFDTIYAAQFPAVHPQCAIALRATFGSEDEGLHKLRLNFVDADGKSIMPPIEIPVNVALPEDAHFLTRNFVLNMQQMKFDQPGVYSVDIAFNGTPKGNVPLLVKKVSPPPGWVPPGQP